MHSAIYHGSLRHRRFVPRPHEFSYRLFMLYVDLAELDSVFRGRWLWSVRRPALAWFRRADFFGDPGVSLEQAVRDRVARETGVRPDGPIRVLTHLRFFGIGFNPVTFYYCYDKDGDKIETIVAEITNTPWKERHAYVLPQRMNVGYTAAPRFIFQKEFHVSPFLSMQFEYDWRFSAPNESLAVHMQNLSDGQKVFDATLVLKRRPINGPALAKALLKFPCMPAMVLAGIYWQALRLWLKRIPFYPHARRKPAESFPATHSNTFNSELPS